MGTIEGQERNRGGQNISTQGAVIPDEILAAENTERTISDYNMPGQFYANTYAIRLPSF